MNLRLPWKRIPAALIGAAVGFLLALLVELTGHPSWFFLAMVVGAIAPSVILALKKSSRIEAFRIECQQLPRWSQFCLILLMIAITLGSKWVLDANPRDYSYLPLVIPVIASAVLFGFGSALFTIFVTALGADYFFALPEYSFILTEWEDALGLAVFAILGALAALAIDDFFNF